jgi:serine protease Do
MMTTEVSNGPALWPAAETVARRLRQSVFAVRSAAGAGSATAWRADGLLATNNHVVPGDQAEVEAWDGSTYPARVVARDTTRDLALLTAQDALVMPVTVRDASTVRVGELVLAVGNPWGRKGEVTVGIVTSTGAPASGPRPPLREAIYADVRLAPGNSGGPLADAAGRVIGINSMIVGGMAVAVPSAAVGALVAGRPAQRGVLGVSILPVELPAGVGLLLTDVFAGSGAEQAGLIPGDIVLAANGVQADLPALVAELALLAAGEPVRIDLLRGGRPLRVQVVASAAA